jgi:hypothetical protein
MGKRLEVNAAHAAWSMLIHVSSVVDLAQFMLEAHTKFHRFRQDR